MRSPVMFLAGAALIAITGTAQAQSTTTTAPPSQGATRPGTSTTGSAPANSAPSALPSPPADTQANLSRQDKYFMQQAADGGMAEVQTGQLALQNAGSDQVKQFAQKMIDDHTKANDELMQIASQKGFTPPTTSSKAEQDAKELQNLKGVAFDRKYAESAVKDHEEDVSLFKEEAQNGADPDLKKYASTTLPTLEQHLTMAKDMRNDLTGTASKHGKKSTHASGSSKGSGSSD